MPKCDKYHAKWKANMAKCSKYHAKCKVTMPKCSKYHAKWQVLVPNCCKYKANGIGKEIQKKTKPEAKKIRELFYTQYFHDFKRSTPCRTKKHMVVRFPFDGFSWLRIFPFLYHTPILPVTSAFIAISYPSPLNIQTAVENRPWIITNGLPHGFSTRFS